MTRNITPGPLIQAISQNVSYISVSFPGYALGINFRFLAIVMDLWITFYDSV